MEESDIEKLTELEEKIFSVPWKKAAFRALLTSPLSVCVVAQAGDRVVGCASMTVLSGEGDIDKVMVEEAFRGQHLAEKMLDSLLETGAQRGVTAYTLEVRTSNEPAIALYRKKGFEGVGVRPRFYEKPAEDALIMWKRQ